MEKMQKSITDEETGDRYFLIIDDDFIRGEFFCPICEFIMNQMSDPDFYQEFGCCSSCGMKFAQSRRDEWKNGWRPSKKQIDEHKMFIESQPLGLFLGDEHN